MLKKKFICLGLSMIMLFTSIINTPAAVTAGQYYKSSIHITRKLLQNEPLMQDITTK